MNLARLAILAGTAALREIARGQAERPGPQIAYERLTTREPATS